MLIGKNVKLNTGAEMPTPGLGTSIIIRSPNAINEISYVYTTSFSGTWRSEPGAVEHAVEFALKNGYKHIDTATAYGNEREVGQGIKASGVAREEIFLTTKLDNPDHKRAADALEESLTKLGTRYLDLCKSAQSSAWC